MTVLKCFGPFQKCGPLSLQPRIHEHVPSALNEGEIYLSGIGHKTHGLNPDYLCATQIPVVDVHRDNDCRKMIYNNELVFVVTNNETFYQVISWNLLMIISITIELRGFRCLN